MVEEAGPSQTCTNTSRDQTLPSRNIVSLNAHRTAFDTRFPKVDDLVERLTQRTQAAAKTNSAID